MNYIVLMLKLVVSFGLLIILAAPLTDLVSMNLANTEWQNILTYLFILFSPILWAWIIFGVIMVVIGVYAICAVILDK